VARALTVHDATRMQVFADGAKDQSLVVEILVSAHTGMAAPYTIAVLCHQL
jgi:hypothetical protein